MVFFAAVPSLARHQLRRLVAASLIASAAAWAEPPASDAAPARPSASDTLMQLLADRGLTPALSSDQLVNSVRDTASDMVATAMNFLGVRYRRGGNSEQTGFDCSGFTRHVFESSLGLLLPRRADEQASAEGLLKVRREELRPGDLVFFNTLRRTFSHVGIYVGDDKFIHSPRAGGAVRVEDMSASYWSRRFTGARRVEIDGAAPVTPRPQ